MMWIPDEIFEEEMEGTGIGGDWARGNGYSIRFHQEGEDAIPGALFTATYYPEVLDGQFEGRFGITGQLEYLICTDPFDPGGTEVWADYDYDEEHALIYDDLAAAEKACRREVERWRDSVADFLMWDGKTRAVR